MLHNVHLVFILVLLHIEHLPELLQLMELTEGLQDHQHGDEAQQQVTCDPDLVELSEFLIVAFPRNIIPRPMVLREIKQK